MHEYRLLKKIGEGTFSEVFEAVSINDDMPVAIKCMKKKYETIEEVKNLTEVKALQNLSPHQNIITLIKVLYDQPTGKLALVFSLMDENLYESLIKKRSLDQQKIKHYMYGILKALAYTHSKGIFHRDIKPQNVLVSGNKVKLADFGSCKKISSKHPYTQYISTRWYRAPQCLMTDGYYDEKMDIWGFGCVFFETISRYPLFSGKNQLDQIDKINKILGTPDQILLQKFKQHASHMKPSDWKFSKHKGVSLSRLLPHHPSEALDLIQKLVIYDPEKRLTAQQALYHPYFQTPLVSPIKMQKLKSTVINFSTLNKEKIKPNGGIHHAAEGGQPHHYNVLSHQHHGNSHINREKDQNIHQRDKQANSLPPIHHLKLDIKPNLFNHTIAAKLKKPHFYKGLHHV